MVLGNVPLDQGNWDNWDNMILTSVLRELNDNGIVAGRDALERKLAASFQRIREITLEGDPTKSIELREIRIKYCDLLMDLLRDDLLQRYDGNVQKGLLGTINFDNTNDTYDIHNGKPITDPALKQAAYNVLFLLHIQIGEHIYTVHMDIDRVKIKSTYGDGQDRCESVSYWVGGMIEYIHNNKGKFLNHVYNALKDFSVRVVPIVDPKSAQCIKQFILGKLAKIGVGDAGAGDAGAGDAGAGDAGVGDAGAGDAGAGGASAVKLEHDAFILSCKSVTLIQGGAIVTPEPNNDNVVGFNTDGKPYILFKGTQFNGKNITGANFNVYYDDQSIRIDAITGKDQPQPYHLCCHFPSYNPRPIDQILAVGEGDVISSQNSEKYVRTDDSLDLVNQLTKEERERGVSPSAAGVSPSAVVGSHQSAFDYLSEYRETQVDEANQLSSEQFLTNKRQKLPVPVGVAAGVAGVAPEQADEEAAERTATDLAANLADAYNTTVNATTEQEKETAKLSLLGILATPTFVAKKVFGVICGSFNFWLKRTSSSPLLHDKVFDTELLDLISLSLTLEIDPNMLLAFTKFCDRISPDSPPNYLEILESNQGTFPEVYHMFDEITSIINQIRDSEMPLELLPPDNRKIYYYPAAVAAVAAGAGGGDRSRRRSAKKKTRRPRRKYYSIKNIKGRGSRISKRKMITRCRSRKRKN
jgi:hypothetical protein